MDRHPPARPSFLAQSLALLTLAARQKRNMFSRLGAGRKGLRTATAHKGDRRLLWPVIFGLLMLGISANTCYQAVHGLAGHARQQWPTASPDAPVITLDHVEYWILEFRFGQRTAPRAPSGSQSADPDPVSALDPASREFLIKNLADTIEERRSLGPQAAEAEARRLLAHYDQHGMAGFAKEQSSAFPPRVRLAELSAEARAWLGRVYAFVFASLFLGIALLPLSTRTRDLGELDAHLEWLYCLPLTSREILGGRFLAMTFVRPMAWFILLPLSGILFLAMGYGLDGVFLAVALTLALNVIATGVELMIETWLRSTASFRVKKNVQAAATILGTVALFVGMGAGFAAARSTAWIDWSLAHLPAFVTSSLGRLVMLPLEGPAGLLPLAAGLGGAMAVCGVGGWLVAARALDRGLVAGHGRVGSRSPAAATARNRSLAKYEWLLLMRDRNLAVLVLVMPLMLVGYQLLINPGLTVTANARNFAAIGFGCGVWAAAMTAPHVIASEARSLWIVFSLPVEIAEYFRRRTTVWRTTGVIMTAAIILGLTVWKGGPPPAEWWRLPAALAGVWVVGLVVYAIMMGDARLPDPASPERPRISVLRMYLCLAIGGAVGALLWGAGPWEVVSGLVIWWFLGFSLWQGVTRKLRYLLEPSHEAPSALTVSHALVAVLIFFAVQLLAARSGLLLPYALAGLAAAIYCAISLARFPPPKPEPAPIRLGSALPLAIFVCIAGGALWLLLLHHVPPFRELYQSAQAEGSVALDLRDWQLVILLVVAAPLVEEFLFRGYVLRIMQGTWSTRSAIIASALLFAIVHPALSFPPVFLLGLATAWLYTRSQRLWPGILLHAAYNAAILSMN